VNAKSLMLLRGLPGSGKTTLAGLLVTIPGAVAVSADDYPGRYDVEDAFLKEEAHDWCLFQTERHMLRKAPVIVVHNTFVTREEIYPYRDLAQAYGYRLFVVTVEGDHWSEHRVPREVMEKMRRDWEPWPGG